MAQLFATGIYTTIWTLPADQQITDHEIYSFEAYRRHQHDDERPAERASMNMLDSDALQSYLAEQRKSRPKFAALPDELACGLLNISPVFRS